MATARKISDTTPEARITPKRKTNPVSRVPGGQPADVDAFRCYDAAASTHALTAEGKDTRGAIWRLPHPVEDRDEIVVIVHPHQGELDDYSSGQGRWAYGIRVRNAGRYDEGKSMALAKQLSTLLRSLEIDDAWDGGLESAWAELEYRRPQDLPKAWQIARGLIEAPAKPERTAAPKAPARKAPPKPAGKAPGKAPDAKTAAAHAALAATTAAAKPAPKLPPKPQGKGAVMAKLGKPGRPAMLASAKGAKSRKAA